MQKQEEKERERGTEKHPQGWTRPSRQPQFYDDKLHFYDDKPRFEDKLHLNRGQQPQSYNDESQLHRKRKSQAYDDEPRSCEDKPHLHRKQKSQSCNDKQQFFDDESHLYDGKLPFYGVFCIQTHEENRPRFFVATKMPDQDGWVNGDMWVFYPGKSSRRLNLYYMEKSIHCTRLGRNLTYMVRSEHYPETCLDVIGAVPMPGPKGTEDIVNCANCANEASASAFEILWKSRCIVKSAVQRG